MRELPRRDALTDFCSKARFRGDTNDRRGPVIVTNTLEEPKNTRGWRSWNASPER